MIAVRNTLLEYVQKADRVIACYLTRTTTCGQTTTTSTVTRPTSTVRVTQVKLTTVTKYNSKTSDVLQTATAVASAVSTDSSTTIIAITETHSLTSVVATITTSKKHHPDCLASLLTLCSDYFNSNRYSDCWGWSLRRSCPLHFHPTRLSWFRLGRIVGFQQSQGLLLSLLRQQRRMSVLEIL